MSQFSGLAQWNPQGNINFPANTSSSLDKSHWAATGGIDQDSTDANASLVMNDSGQLVFPSSGSFEITSFIDLSDFGYTGDMMVTYTYIPVNSLSQSKQYTMGQSNLSSTATTYLFEQRVTGNTGDLISITFTPSSSINTDVINVPANSSLVFTDVTNDTDQQYWYGVAGSPPKYANLNKKSLMQTMKVGANGIVTVILTQDGTTTGQSLFSQIVSANLSFQSSTDISGSTNTPSFAWNPFSTDLKVITAKATMNGMNLPTTWTALAEIKGK